MEDLDHVKQAVKGDLAYLQPPAQSRDMKPAASLLVDSNRSACCRRPLENDGHLRPFVGAGLDG